MTSTTHEAIDAVPRLGWADTPTPLDPAPGLAAAIGLDELLCKRDDQSGPIRGGTKVRKLDMLLADPRFRDAPSWASVGAVGSSHLLALADAAELLDRELHAYVFWTPVSEGVSESYRALRAGPTRLYTTANRPTLALRWPRALTGPTVGGVPVVPAGGTDPVGTVGTVRAGLELVAQLDALSADEPRPTRLYIAVGSGGAAAGISIGLGLAGVPVEVHAVATVERVFLSRRRLERLQRDAVRLIFGAAGPPAGFAPADVRIRRSFLGRGYGQTTPDSSRCAGLLQAHGLPGEPIYTGKALACLERDACEGEVRRAVFWMTAGGMVLAEAQSF